MRSWLDEDVRTMCPIEGFLRRPGPYMAPSYARSLVLQWRFSSATHERGDVGAE